MKLRALCSFAIVYGMTTYGISEVGNLLGIQGYYEALEGKWGVVESVSGPGSTLEQTQTVRLMLPLILTSYNVRTIVDSPCGDFHWMKTIDIGNRVYVGVDVVPLLIEKNSSLYHTDTRMFICRDLIFDIVPEADLIISRDFLVHLSDEDVKTTLKNFKKSGSKYLLTTTFPTRGNVKISSGGWRPINLQKPPFNLPAPLYLFAENCTEQGGAYKDKSLGLWKLADIVVD